MNTNVTFHITNPLIGDMRRERSRHRPYKGHDVLFSVRSNSEINGKDTIAPLSLIQDMRSHAKDKTIARLLDYFFLQLISDL